MSRLHYNQLIEYLNADIDDAVTTFALTAPLKEGGVNIPSVVAPDVLPLTIDREVIHVTAYTSGSNTITSCLRGQDDTLEDEHNIGSMVFHAIGKEDIFEPTPSAGSGTLLIAADDSLDIYKDRADYLCDGVNDEVQIQAAVNAIVAGGDEGIIEFAPGYYALGATVTIPDPGGGQAASIVFRGLTGARKFYGYGVYLDRSATANYHMLTAVGNSCKIFLENLSCETGGTNTSALFGGTALFPKWYFRNCIAFEYGGPGSHILSVTTSGTTVDMEGCQFEAEGAVVLCTGTTVGSGALHIRDSYMYGYDGAFAPIHLLVGAQWEVRLENLECWGNNAYAVRIDGNTGATPMPKVIIEGGRYDSNFLENIYISDAAWVHIKDVLRLGESAEHNIRLSNVDHGSIVSCVMGTPTAGNNKHGIWLLDCEQMVVEGNEIFRPGLGGDAVYSGIILDGDTNACLVQGNKVWGTGSANRALNGIRVDDSTCDNNTIINNDLRASSRDAGSEIFDAGTGTVMGLEPALLDGWFQDNVVASQSAVALAMSNGRAELPMPADGYITGIAVYSNEARTAGTLTVDPTINGTVVGLTAVLDGTNTQTKATRQGSSADKFTAGQRVGVKLTTDAGWLPTTADITVVVMVVLNTANRT